MDMEQTRTASTTSTSATAMRQWLLGLVAAAVLAIVFMAYLRPAFIVDLANRIVLCS